MRLIRSPVQAIQRFNSSRHPVVSCSVNPDSPTTPSVLKPVLSIIALVLLGGLLLTGAYLWYAADRQAETETRNLGHALAKQTTFLIRPLVLADDRISENYLLKELVELEYIKGLQLSDAQGTVLAKAGESEGESIQRKMMQQEKLLGTLTLWLDEKPLQKILRKQLLLALLMVLLLTSILALAIWYRLRPRSAFESDTERAEQDEHYDPDDDRYDPDYDDFDESQEQETREEPQGFETGDADNLSPQDNHDLVDLLRPEESNTPSFSPSSPPSSADSASRFPAEGMVEEQIELTEQTLEENSSDLIADPPNAAKKPSANPLLNRSRDEEQLDLYTFEHEMELLLDAKDAAYLVYIDTTSAHTEYADSSERDELLQIYQQLALQVAHIYSGVLQPLANGDLQILFQQPLDKDGHGVNAVCSGLLFTLLYRGFNQERIRQFKPVLNTHIALVRGHNSKPELLREEARFLTRTTQSNELISHTALTEAPDIKSTLLKDADIRREDEDKVLIYKVVKRYQELFDKQSNHLLVKLRQRMQETQ